MTTIEKLEDFINENYANPFTQWTIDEEPEYGYLKITDGCAEIRLHFDEDESFSDCLSTREGCGCDLECLEVACEILRDRDEILAKLNDEDEE